MEIIKTENTIKVIVPENTTKYEDNIITYNQESKNKTNNDFFVKNFNKNKKNYVFIKIDDIVFTLSDNKIKGYSYKKSFYGDINKDVTINFLSVNDENKLKNSIYLEERLPDV